MATFVLIHGSGDVGWYWHLVEAELRSGGHDTVAPDLPCDDDSAGLSEYVEEVRESYDDPIALFPPPTSAAWLGSAWASPPTRSTAGTPRRSAARRSWPSASRHSPPRQA
jgi:hypothetical protein